MTTPGSDPAFPPYGWGDGTAAIARGPDAFEQPFQDPADAYTEPDVSRRKKRAERQELGFTILSVAAYQPEPMAAVQPNTIPELRHAFPGESLQPDDAHSAAPHVTQ